MITPLKISDAGGMSRQRFEFALERLDDTSWSDFEIFSSAFLSGEFPSIRTLATKGGDGGRDAILFSPADEAAIVLQYSVSKNWSAKIRQTAERISVLTPPPTYLIYCTNHNIGSRSDTIRKELRSNFRLHLDVRDSSWFLDRAFNTDSAVKIFDELARKIVDPYLNSRRLIENQAQALSSDEQKAAFVYLALQWEDDNRDKSLTRTCFEALVRNALRNSTAEEPVSRQQLYQRIISFLPHHPAESIKKFTDQAIRRLTKKAIRHYQKEDKFCLSHEERIRLNDRTTSPQRSGSLDRCAARA